MTCKAQGSRTNLYAVSDHRPTIANSRALERQREGAAGRKMASVAHIRWLSGAAPTQNHRSTSCPQLTMLGGFGGDGDTGPRRWPLFLPFRAYVARQHWTSARDPAGRGRPPQGRLTVFVQARVPQVTMAPGVAAIAAAWINSGKYTAAPFACHEMPLFRAHVGRYLF